MLIANGSCFSKMANSDFFQGTHCLGLNGLRMLTALIEFVAQRRDLVAFLLCGNVF